MQMSFKEEPPKERLSLPFHSNFADIHVIYVKFFSPLKMAKKGGGVSL